MCSVVYAFQIELMHILAGDIGFLFIVVYAFQIELMHIKVKSKQEKVLNHPPSNAIILLTTQPTGRNLHCRFKYVSLPPHEQ